MQQVVLMAWLFLSHGFVFALGGWALEERIFWLAAVLFIGVPAWRLYRRFREPRGYYLLGYGSAAGGDRHQSGGWISRKRDPNRFQFSFACEIFVILYFPFVAYLGPRIAPYLKSWL
jgi:hypothetical protein